MLILRSGRGRSVGSRGRYVHKKWCTATSGFTNELHSMVSDAVSKVVCLVVASVLFCHTLVGHSVVIELAAVDGSR